MARGTVVGRRREIAAITDAFRDGARLVVVSGEAGVGKSALVEAAVAASERTVLTASCLPLTETLPLLPVADLLRAAADLDRAWLDTALASCPAYVHAVLPRIVPDLLPDQRGGGVEADPWLRQQLFSAVAELVSRLAASRDLLLVLEDMHWADGSTLDLLWLLAAGQRPWGADVVATFRTDDPSTPLASAEWLDRLLTRPTVRSVPVPALEAIETAELVARLTGSWPGTAVAERIHARSEGNPLFVEQLCRAGPDALPPSLAAGYQRALGGLGVQARTLARVLAVAARPVTHTDLAELWPASADTVDAAVRELRAAHLLDPRLPRSRLRLRHALLADVAADDIPVEARRRLHGRAAGWLARGVTPPPYAEIAGHLRLAGAPREELVARVDAAREADEVLAHAEQADHLLRVLDLWDEVPDAESLAGLTRFDAILAADWALFDSGQSDRDAVMLRQELDALPPEEVKQRATLLRRLARAVSWRDGAEGAQLMRQAGELFECAPGGLDHVLMLADLTDLRRLEGRLEESVTCADQALHACRAEPGLGLERSVAARRALALAWAGRDEEALATLDGLDRAPARTLRERIVAAARQVEALSSMDRNADAVDAAAALLEEADVYGAVGARLVGLLRSLVAAALVRLGRTDEARRLLGTARREAPAEDSAMFDGVCAELAIVDGHLDEAVRLLGGAAPFGDWPSARFEAAERRAEALLWAGRPLDGASMLEPVLESLAGSGLGALAGPGLVLLARARADAADVRRGDRDPANLTGLQAALPGDPLARPRLAALWSAELARLSGAADPAAWSEAAQLHEQLGRRFGAAYCCWREALALLAQRSRKEADPVLRRAHALAQRHRPLTEAIARTARTARVDLAPEQLSVPAQPGDPFGLTARELEVLGELATGKTNRQIGASLFMSPKTVSVHVSNIMRKVDATSRTQAVAILQRAGLVD